MRYMTNQGEQGQVEVVGRVRHHSKASETYRDVIFHYEDDRTWRGSIPITDHWIGLDLNEPQEVKEYLDKAHDFCHPKNWSEWELEQEKFWRGKPNATVTRSFFDAMLSFAWTCSCKFPANTNPQRRIQQIKQFGYTIASYPSRPCSDCNKKRMAHLMVPLPRNGISGYETWSSELRSRIIDLLKGYDVYEDKDRPGNKDSLLPDHKFPQKRWNRETRRRSLEGLSDAELKQDLQLMSNQRNLQKREACHKCFNSNKRGTPFGIKFYYVGDEEWPVESKKGKQAEEGCKGCGWYDMKVWREALNLSLAKLGGAASSSSTLLAEEGEL